ncbi:MAG: helix-turn-helix transcriptional regulator [Candidatus Enteromonas sp.]|nr:helix-turn-helix transcriptional regulator [Candidatus Enteromonas sp.]
MTLGQKLKKLRTDKGLTQKDLADQLHVAFQTISKWESDTNEPDIATLKELAKFYGCSFDYILSDNEEDTKEVVGDEPTETPKEEATKTVVIHQSELHVCAKCGKDIPESELVSEDAYKNERYGRHTRTVSVGQTYYHKSCLDKVKKEREETARRIKQAKASSSKKKCFGWGAAAGIIGLGIALAVFLTNTDIIHPALGVLYSFIVGYGLFAMLYCIISGSYIGDVFVWCAKLSIKFPGLIFTWDLDGIAWLIAMKILFAILGFLIGVFALIFAIALSALLGGISFPFVLIHNIRTNYEDAF